MKSMHFLKPSHLNFKRVFISGFTPPAAFLFNFILAGCFLLTSCEKVIDLDLEGVEKKYMIEGIVTNQSGESKVMITQTKDFDENNDFPGVSGASVYITDQNSGTTVELSETSTGIYETSALTGECGSTYTLEVRIGEETFTGSSTMPEVVPMDTIYVTEENIFGETWKLANIVLQDPPGIENSYRYIQHINGVKTKQLFIRNDDLVDGRNAPTKLYMSPDMEEEDRIKSGDELRIEMHCIDAAVYKYWYSLEQGATGDGGSATPANPVTNIQGGALGYFSAQTRQVSTMVVP